jgi:hypothetical protein
LTSFRTPDHHHLLPHDQQARPAERISECDFIADAAFLTSLSKTKPVKSNLLTKTGVFVVQVLVHGTVIVALESNV